jgi:hypothetical protein
VDQGCNQTKIMESRSPGAATRSEYSQTRRSYRHRRLRGIFRDCACPLDCGLEAMLFHPPVERAATETKGLGGLADVSLKALQGLAD